MENKASILLVEDDQALGYLIREYLGMKGFEMTWVQNGLDKSGSEWYGLTRCLWLK